MQHINLIDPSLLPPQHVVSGSRLLSVALVGALLVFAHWSIERLALARALATAPTESTDGATPTNKANEDLAQLREQLAQREALRDLLASDHLPQQPAALLGAVVDALPPTLWLTDVELARDRALRIGGGALDTAALDRFAAALANVADLRGVPVHTVRLEPMERNGQPHPSAGWRFMLANSAASTAGER